MEKICHATFAPEIFKNGPGYRIVGDLKGVRGDRDEFVWHAPDDSAITIMFPPCGDPLCIGSKTLRPGGEFKRNLFGTFAAGQYRYAIFCHKTNNFAIMNSDPEIIISE